MVMGVKIESDAAELVAPVGGEYTPAQRRRIDAQLQKAAKGATYGPFTTAQARRFLEAEIKRRSKKLKSAPSVPA